MKLHGPVANYVMNDPINETAEKEASKSFWLVEGRKSEEKKTNIFLQRLSQSALFSDVCVLHDVHNSVLFDIEETLPNKKLHLTGKIDVLVSVCPVSSDKYTQLANALMGIELKCDILDDLNSYTRQAVTQLVLCALNSIYARCENVLTDGYNWRFFSLSRNEDYGQINVTNIYGYERGVDMLKTRVNEIIGSSTVKNVFHGLLDVNGDDDLDDDDEKDDGDAGGKKNSKSLLPAPFRINASSSASNTFSIEKEVKENNNSGNQSKEEYKREVAKALFWQLYEHSPILSGA
jgi:hypothetical protein